MSLVDTVSAIPAEARSLYERACSEALVEIPDGPPVLDRVAIEGLLPHRVPFLFVDRVLSLRDGWVVAECDMEHYPEVFGGHFPGAPRWPGVLQVEAVTQAGLLGRQAAEGSRELALTHVHGARFMREIPPGDPIQLVSRAFDDGLLLVVVGQVLRAGMPCSATIASCLW
jgi:3-hydroxymyristoyl/3-hydroxydecanoyl-(acyl carrier protein) dehydratase